MIKTAAAFLLFAVLSPLVHATVTITVSDEAVGNTIAGREAARSLDTNWVNNLAHGAFSPDLFSNGNGHQGTNTFTDTGGLAYQVNWQAGYINDSGPGLPASTQFIPTDTGYISYGVSNTLQGSAPNPLPETRLSTAFSAPGLNAIQLDFSHSHTPITAFGIFIGDTESRPNNGTLARILVYDLTGTLLRDHPLIYTGTVLNGTDYTVTEPLGLPSGTANNDKGDWGNDTTAFVSIQSTTPIGRVIFHTGDDDHTSLNNGTSEQIGLVGFQLPDTPTNALTLSKTVRNVTQNTPATNGQNTAVPGDTLHYRITYHNHGNTPITDLAISDPLPAFTQLIDGSLSCDNTPADLLCTPEIPQIPHIKWLFSGHLIPNAQGSVSYHVIVE